MADPETLKAAIAAWEKEADAKRHKAKQDELQSLFEEYKSERRRGLV
jgi:predicted RNase H-like nuclease (RuvC/YqgF family)